MTTWTGQALLLADDIREPGFAAAAACASAWQARVDPDATHGLVGAALALTDGEAMPGLWAPVPPCPDDATLLAGVTELEGAVAELLEYARRMAGDCREALGAAQARAAGAAAVLASSPAPEAVAEAESALAAAQSEIADCEAALEILDGIEKRLAHALNCLRGVPEDLAATYETPYQVVRDGGRLPYDGNFLTGPAAA
jgi:hypothetical protein